MARRALILNFTADTYHWGCFGTATEVYDSLVERGYSVATMSVHQTHGFTPSPATFDEMNDPAFRRSACDANPILTDALREADVVVVNGEGTLHRSHPAPRNLLFLMHLARHHFGKPVHLINHSFFPSGSTDASAELDPMYRAVAVGLARVVPREALSLGVHRRLGIEAVQGFDCLPRFIARHRERLTLTRNHRGPLLLSGGVNFTPDTSRQISRAAAGCREPGQRVVYLTGARSQPAREDTAIYGFMKADIPDLECFDAATMNDWLDAIASAQCLVSGRFHHTLAAAMLGTPAAAFPSNTPKLQAACEMLGLNAPLTFDDPETDARLVQFVESARSGHARVITDATRQQVLVLAEANFTGL
ncbi:MAG: polysaccharide pyruvyl transferase family protein [Acidobacteria bacterium]|nr:polysaccharide pyruvyl transferase family protein [Acidobacteriota bacterium]